MSLLGQKEIITGNILVRSATELYVFGVGEEKPLYCYADATYSGEIDGPAAEPFVAVDRAI